MPYPSAVSKQLTPRSSARPDGPPELGLLDLPVAAPDLPAPEADGRHLEAGPSEWSTLHRVILPLTGSGGVPPPRTNTAVIGP